MINIEAFKGDREEKHFRRQLGQKELLHNITVPEELRDKFDLNCVGPQIFDPAKLVEIYLHQKKFEALESIMREKQAGLDHKYYPNTSSRKTIRERLNLRNSKGLPMLQKKKARALMSEIKRVKSIFCHRSLTEEYQGKLNSRPDLRFESDKRFQDHDIGFIRWQRQNL